MKQKQLKSYWILGLMSVLLLVCTGCPKLPNNPTPPPHHHDT